VRRSPPDQASGDGGAPGWAGRHRRAVSAAAAAAALVAFAIFVVPQIGGLDRTLRRLERGDMAWFAVGTALEAFSMGAYVALVRAVFAPESDRIGWRASTQITLAGDAATKLFAAAGAGGVALTVWALRAAGLRSDTVARGMVCLEVLLYAVYMSALVVGGLGLHLGVFAGPAPYGLTVVPAALAVVVIALALSTLRAGDRWERWLRSRAERSSGRTQTWWKRAAGLPRALAGGLRSAASLARTDPPAAVAAAAYWALDMGALWASFRAFGESIPLAVLVVGYFVGTLANALPLPGGIGGVEGGLIGAFIAFGVDAGAAVLAVLAYRTISYWLPTVPGAIAYVRLRGTVSAWRRQSGPATASSAASEGAK
jgi:uncharacterized protein (TIRG00374 family)